MYEFTLRFLCFKYENHKYPRFNYWIYILKYALFRMENRVKQQKTECIQFRRQLHLKTLDLKFTWNGLEELELYNIVPVHI